MKVSEHIYTYDGDMRRWACSMGIILAVVWAGQAAPIGHSLSIGIAGMWHVLRNYFTCLARERNESVLEAQFAKIKGFSAIYPHLLVICSSRSQISAMVHPIGVQRAWALWSDTTQSYESAKSSFQVSVRPQRSTNIIPADENGEGRAP